MAFLLLVVTILCVYNSFKIDLTLWYRSAFSDAQAPDGKCGWSLGRGAVSKFLSTHSLNGSSHIVVRECFFWLEN